MIRDFETSEQYQRMQNMQLDITSNQLFALQLGIDTKLNVILKTLSILLAKSDGGDQKKILASLYMEVNEGIITGLDDYFKESDKESK